MKLAIVASFFFARAAFAACGPVTSFVVDYADDFNDGDCTIVGKCSLRAAVNAANAQASATSCYFAIDVSQQSRININSELDITDSGSTKVVSISGGTTTATTAIAAAGSRVFKIESGVLLTVALDGIIIEGGSATMGGNIFNAGGTLEINNAIVQNGAANQGAGIYNLGPLTLNSTLLQQNDSSDTNPVGIGLYTTGSTTVVNSTVYSNVDATDTAVGGGVYATGPLFVQNSTIAYNLAKDGAGIAVAGTGAAHLFSVTIADNYTYSQVDGIGQLFTSDTGSIDLTDTLIGSNADVVPSSDCSGSNITSNGHNLDADGTCGFSNAGDLTGDAGISGYSPTTGQMILTFRSAALDAGLQPNCTDAHGGALITDEAGNPRTLAAAGYCDIGAFEYQAKCGDFVTTLGLETCDDGNPPPGDTVDGNGGTGSGCSSTCQALPSCNSENYEYFVTTLADGVGRCDEFSSPYNCSTLRAAVSRINSDPRTSCNYSIRLVPAGTYTLTLTGPGEDNNATGDIDILQPNPGNNRDVSFLGTDAATTIVDGSTLGDRLFDMQSDANLFVSFNNMTLQNGDAGSDNGGLVRASATTYFDQAMLTGGAAADGGGVYCATYCNVNTTAIVGNSATNFGAGAYFSGGFVYDATIANNSGAVSGGGIYNSGSELQLTETTVADNSADAGAGIYSNATTQLFNVTIAYNTASGDGGGTYSVSPSGTFAFADTLMASNTPENCSGDSATAITSSAGYNFDSGATCALQGTADIQNQNPHIGALADNGGSVQTIAFTAASAAIDGGNSTTGCLDAYGQVIAADEIGDPIFLTCDIGAFELQGTCGDGILQPANSEECDDGANNGTEGDNCSASCQTVVGGTTTGGSTSGSSAGTTSGSSSSGGNSSGSTGGQLSGSGSGSSGGSSTSGASSGGSTGSSTLNSSSSTGGSSAMTSSGSSGTGGATTTTGGKKSGCSCHAENSPSDDFTLSAAMILFVLRRRQLWRRKKTRVAATVPPRQKV